jgi:hypothetical protein
MEFKVILRLMLARLVWGSADGRSNKNWKQLAIERLDEPTHSGEHEKYLRVHITRPSQ